LVFGFLSVTGRLALITPILIYLISKHYLHNRSLRRIVLVSGLVLFVLFPVKMFLRDIPSALNQYFISSHTGFSHAYKDKSYHDPIGGIFYSGFLEPERYVDVQVNFGNVRDLAADSTIGRIGQLHVFSVIINNTHEYVYGRNIPYLLNHVGVPNSLIERFAGIGPGTEFGIKNGFVINTWTGVAPTQMGDLYINFGMPGIVFGMMVLGYLFRRIFESLASSPYPSGIFIYSILWIVMMHGLEQSLSAAYGKALQIFLIMVAIQFFISCVPLFGKARILGRQSPSA
jgi:hypothetical protein